MDKCLCMIRIVRNHTHLCIYTCSPEQNVIGITSSALYVARCLSKVMLMIGLGRPRALLIVYSVKKLIH